MKYLIIITSFVAISMCFATDYLWCTNCQRLVALGGWSRSAMPSEGTHTCIGSGELSCTAWASEKGRCLGCNVLFEKVGDSGNVELAVTAGGSDTGSVTLDDVGTASWTLKSIEGN